MFESTATTLQTSDLGAMGDLTTPPPPYTHVGGNLNEWLTPTHTFNIGHRWQEAIGEKAVFQL